ncbi:MAG: hypothetical protein UR27_C0007G0078 [Candidatus Peregrinibacteria bacterium GW2011_GWA2_33_10]|nr:MAG: hypothetical protein UR27_C0007G0078 [Candidatus Peregrinibacteria bacterium GW2011_GWA2_33_10]KKP40861.1 MAG: hypothetical protein UR30_C0003G0033 [Candidatus Peregrinibacteria bacterium GW2011_GWC2_33_13]
MKNLIKISILLTGILLISGIAKAYYSLGNPGGFVNDYTNTLNQEQKTQLEQKLTNFEKETSNEISVVIIESLKEDTIENFAAELFEDWGIGKKDINNGILLLIAKQEREMKIEIGYGLEGALTDAQSYWIQEEILIPAFKSNDFHKGINEATDKIIAATKGEYVPSLDKPNTSVWEGALWFIFFGIMWLSAILARSKSWWLGGVIGGIIGIIITLIKGFFFIGILSIIFLIPAGLLFDYIVSKNYNAGKAKGHIPWWVGGSGRSGGGGGFGGFGGGMSGGAGSSGRW